jgi:hypothetical protein
VAKICTAGGEGRLSSASRTSIGDRVGLLSRRAARDPDAERILGRAGSQQRHESAVRQDLERIRVAEERGHADQQLTEQRRGLVRVGTQPLEIGGRGVQPEDAHAPLGAPHERRGFVVTKIMPGAVAQHGADLGHEGQQLGTAAGRATDGGDARRAMTRMIAEGGCERLRRADMVGEAGGCRRIGHAGMRGAATVLRHAEPARAADRLQAHRAVRAGPREHDADRAWTEGLRRRAEQPVDRIAAFVARPAGPSPRAQPAGAEHRVDVGRHHQQGVRLRPQAGPGNRDLQRGRTAEHLGEQRLVARCKVLRQRSIGPADPAARPGSAAARQVPRQTRRSPPQAAQPGRRLRHPAARFRRQRRLPWVSRSAFGRCGRQT